ncbi:hypothetical protein ABGB12_18755 [Actinocorallia sp. B10E7]|uniref:hypothetical protein n=1 Tax=Actinocorallia sp. B10E7 TaxID=3153558 RepID=UPI00325DAB57
MKYSTLLKVSPPGGSQNTDVAFDQLMDALVGIEEADPFVEDVDLGADLHAGWIEVRMLVTAADQGEAAMHAFTALRTAIHALGGITRGWDTETYSLQVSPAATPVSA